jgi:hypothetical protein
MAMPVLNGLVECTVLAQPVKTSTSNPITMLEGYALEVTLTTANAAAQAWYGYEQVSY